MSRVRVVSIVHPTRMEAVPEHRFELLPNLEATILVPSEAGAGTQSTAVRRVSVPTRGRGRAATFPSLAMALALLDPAIVHLQADPDTELASQVARLAVKQRRFGLVVETEADGCSGSGWSMISSLRARRVLANTGALVARSAGALTCMRRLGFRGVGVVAASGREVEPIPTAQEAKRLLAIDPDVALVLGWAAPAHLKSGILNVLEAIAASDANVCLIIAASGSAKQQLADRADALEILHRIRFIPPLRDADENRAPILADHSAVAGAICALLLASPRERSSRITAVKNVEFAQSHGIPVIYPYDPEFAEIVGPGGWSVPPCDPSLMARLLITLCRLPDLVSEASAAAASHAARRHSPEAAAADLDRAIHAVITAQGGQRPAPKAHGKRHGFRLAVKREPSRT